ncbi:hypothetical protein SAMN06265367_103567 [Algoriphagus winogradskyi]|uniref:Uncharacterized protein n=1 Tax=Algoriphagus winogradskyi TaxID=237017 RepID=A0ABY1P0M9_9BACT|nr:hypothetical protein SAMN06265367_103567 [Algoriphagus winogradskyi]
MLNGFCVFPYTQPPKITRKKVSFLLNQPMKSRLFQVSYTRTIMRNARFHVTIKIQIITHEKSNFHAL